MEVFLSLGLIIKGGINKKRDLSPFLVMLLVLPVFPLHPF